MRDVHGFAASGTLHAVFVEMTSIWPQVAPGWAAQDNFPAPGAG